MFSLIHNVKRGRYPHATHLTIVRMGKLFVLKGNHIVKMGRHEKRKGRHRKKKGKHVVFTCTLTGTWENIEKVPIFLL